MVTAEVVLNGSKYLPASLGNIDVDAIIRAIKVIIALNVKQFLVKAGQIWK